MRWCYSRGACTHCRSGLEARKTKARGRLKRAAIFSRVDRLAAPFLVAQVGSLRARRFLWPGLPTCLGHLLRLTPKEVVLDHDKGAFTMAGQLIGAPAPQSPVSHHEAQRAPRRVIASSRRRLNHGVFQLGNELASVYSSRRASDGHGVSMAVGTGSLVLTGSMTASQARAMARALIAAASAVESQGATA